MFVLPSTGFELTPCLNRNIDNRTDVYSAIIALINCQHTSFFKVHLKYNRVCLHVIFKYLTQNEVHDLFRDDTEGVILFRVAERNETERSETKRNDFVSCFSN